MVLSPYNGYKAREDKHGNDLSFAQLPQDSDLLRISGTVGGQIPMETERVRPRFTVNNHEVTRAQAERIMLGKCNIHG